MSNHRLSRIDVGKYALDGVLALMAVFASWRSVGSVGKIIELVAAIVLLIIFLWSAGSWLSRLARRMVLVLATVLGLLALGEVWSATQTRHDGLVRQQRIRNFVVCLRDRKWIAYEIDPHLSNTQGELDTIRQQLKAIKDMGFDGLITFTADGINAQIPTIARSVGFAGIIMGILTLDDDEIRSALEQDGWVDAYSVTHNLEGRDYKGIDPNKLVDVLHRIADKTNKPVTTTLRPDSYRTYPEVTAASDFLFPDLHGEWYSQADPGELRFETRKLVDQMTGIRNDHYSDKPILIKMVSFPTCDARGASETAQRRFFNLIHQDLISSASAPARVYVSYFAAFDPRWKTPPDFEPGEVCIGLLKEGPSGTFVARPAVSEIMKKR